MKKFMKENYLNSNIKLNRFNGFLSVEAKNSATSSKCLYFLKIYNLFAYHQSV